MQTKTVAKPQIKKEGKLVALKSEIKKDYTHTIYFNADEYEDDEDKVDICVYLHSPTKQNHYIVRTWLSHATNSCGVSELNNISTFNDVFPSASKIPNKEEIVKNMIIDVIKEAKKVSAFVMISNNDNTPFVNGILDKLSHTYTEYRLNKNSGKNIKVWIF